MLSRIASNSPVGAARAARGLTTVHRPRPRPTPTSTLPRTSSILFTTCSPPSRPLSSPHLVNRHLSTTPNLPQSQSSKSSAADEQEGEEEADEEDQRLRSSYVNSLKDSGAEAWPKDAFEISFSRSSGPGGQNVNKLNTKAQLRYALFPSGGGASSRSHPHPPPRLIPLLQTSRYYVPSTSSLLLTSQSTRSASNNALDVVERFHNHLIELFSQGLKGETSEETRERVRGLERRDKKRKELNKRKRGEVKSGRRAGRNARDFM